MTLAVEAMLAISAMEPPWLCPAILVVTVGVIRLSPPSNGGR